MNNLQNDLLKNARPATKEEIEAQAAGYAASACNRGERQAVPAMAARPYASIDIETTGTDHEWCQVLEVGVVIDDWVSPVASLPQFHCYIVHDRIVGQPYALALNAEILRRIDRRDKPENKDFRFLQPYDLGIELKSFFKVHGLGDSREKSVVCGGKNFGSFDLQFLNKIGAFQDIHLCHRGVDPGMLYWNPMIDAEPPSSKTCKERAGLPGEVAHTAIADALDVIHMVRNAHARTVYVGTEGKVVGNDGRKLSAREVAKGLTEQFIRNGQFVR